MTNILLNKIYENLITISRTKDNMDECVQDNKSYYEKDIDCFVIITFCNYIYLICDFESAFPFWLSLLL